jgi:hypothetical protein
MPGDKNLGLDLELKSFFLGGPLANGDVDVLEAVGFLLQPAPTLFFGEATEPFSGGDPNPLSGAGGGEPKENEENEGD